MMSHKNSMKQDFVAVGAPTNKAIEINYSDLPLFGFCISEPLSLAMDKKNDFYENKLTSKPPSPIAPKTGTAKPGKPQVSRAIPVATPDELIETNTVLLTVSDICKLLKVSRSTLIRMEKSGQLPGRLMLGGSVRYHRETIDAWLRGLATNPS